MNTEARQRYVEEVNKDLLERLDYWKKRADAAEKCLEALDYESELNPVVRAMVYDKGTFLRAKGMLLKLKQNEPLQ